MLIFIGMMWRTTILLFSQTIERVIPPANDNSYVASEYAGRSSLAAQDIICLATKLSRLNWFKVRTLQLSPLFTGHQSAYIDFAGTSTHADSIITMRGASWFTLRAR